MTDDRDLSLLALLEWEERWARWESLPEADRARLVAELSRLMIKLWDARDEFGEDFGATP